MPSFTSKEYFKIHFHKTIFQKEANMSLILFVLAGTTQDLESLEEQKLKLSLYNTKGYKLSIFVQLCTHFNPSKS